MDFGEYIFEGNTDAVEFCPRSPFHNVLAASTYVLQEGDKASRSGSILLFDVDADEGKLELIYKVETAGIFDIKWNPYDLTSRALLAQADADGYVQIHSLQDSNSQDSKHIGTRLSTVCASHISSAMCLSVDWNQSASMAVGLSDGSVSIVSLNQAELSTLQEWKAHDFEVWTASFDIQQPTVVYTGSDDCKFIGWDLRDKPCNSIFRNTKAHTMGVCIIAKSPSDPNTLLTGSYDEQLRVWDVRSMSKPVNESSVGLGGGVWRIKHHPVIPGLVLTACMHNGFAVVKFDGTGVQVVETYEKHGSLAYGADWQRADVAGNGKRKSAAIATCSFYDRMLRVWKPQFELYAGSIQAS